MKKLTLTLALVFALSIGAFAQGFINNLDEYEEKGLFGRGLGLFRSEDEMPFLPEGHNLEEDQPATPLGGGVLLLMGLGAAYAVAKKRED